MALVVALVVALVAASVSSPLNQSVSLVYAQEKMVEESQKCGLDYSSLKPEQLISNSILPMAEGFFSLEMYEIKSFEVGFIQISNDEILLNNLSMIIEVFAFDWNYVDGEIVERWISDGYLAFTVSNLIYIYTGEYLSINIKDVSFTITNNQNIDLESGLSDFYIKAECNKSVAEERSFN